jgi:hypothetical protein
MTTRTQWITETCPSSGKLRFPDEASVRAELASCIEQAMLGNKRRMEKSAYECPECLGFHLSSHFFGDGEIVRVVRMCGA